MGSKNERQNQHLVKLNAKIRRFTTKGLSVAGLQKELAYCEGDKARPACRTGRSADHRFKPKANHAE